MGPACSTCACGEAGSSASRRASSGGGHSPVRPMLHANGSPPIPGSSNAGRQHATGGQQSSATHHHEHQQQYSLRQNSSSADNNSFGSGSGPLTSPTVPRLAFANAGIYVPHAGVRRESIDSFADSNIGGPSANESPNENVLLGPPLDAGPLSAKLSSANRAGAGGGGGAGNKSPAEQAPHSIEAMIANQSAAAEGTLSGTSSESVETVMSAMAFVTLHSQQSSAPPSLVKTTSPQNSSAKLEQPPLLQQNRHSPRDCS